MAKPLYTVNEVFVREFTQAFLFGMFSACACDGHTSSSISRVFQTTRCLNLIPRSTIENTRGTLEANLTKPVVRPAGVRSEVG